MPIMSNRIFSCFNEHNVFLNFAEWLKKQLFLKIVKINKCVLFALSKLFFPIFSISMVTICLAPPKSAKVSKAQVVFCEYVANVDKA